MTISLNVSTEADLRAAIFQISNDFATDRVVNDDYVINITGDIDLTQSLPMIRGDGVHTITINGNGHTIDAERQRPGLLRRERQGRDQRRHHRQRRGAGRQWWRRRRALGPAVAAGSAPAAQCS